MTEYEQLIQEFKDVCFKVVMEEFKSNTSWRNKNNFDDVVEESGWTGVFTYFGEHYDGRRYDFVEIVKILWNDVD